MYCYIVYNKCIYLAFIFGGKKCKGEFGGIYMKPLMEDRNKGDAYDKKKTYTAHIVYANGFKSNISESFPNQSQFVDYILKKIDKNKLLMLVIQEQDKKPE